MESVLKPQLRKFLISLLNIKAMLTNLTTEMEMMIKEYNPILLSQNNAYEEWLKICCEFADKYKVPLREWIEKKPKFSFSM